MLVRALQRNWTNQIRVHAEQISFKEQAPVDDGGVWRISDVRAGGPGSADVERLKSSHRCPNRGTHSLVLIAMKTHWFMSIGRREMP